MNLQLFAWRPFAMGALVALIYGTALFGSTYLLPVYMQMGLGLSAASVGAILLPSGLVLAVTIPLVARKGRASYLGERSAGHQDPGATSSYLLLRTASETWADSG